jgi:TRAP-type C4-dicarboxylate transport system permease small subunit
MMEEDKLLRFHERLKDFVSKHLNLFLNIVGILALLILLGFGYNYYTKKKEEKAFLNKGGRRLLFLALPRKTLIPKLGGLPSSTFGI